MVHRSQLTLILIGQFLFDLCLSNTLPSSCIGAEDGHHWLQLMDSDEYPVINQKCSNEYMIIDINRDPNVINYFSSYDTWHYGLGGPQSMDGPNWESWWLPNVEYTESSSSTDDYFSYILSPDCSSCDIYNNKDIDYNQKSLVDDIDLDRMAYYMTGTIFGCLYTHKALRDCVWDWDSYQCGYCTTAYSDADLGYHVMYESEDENDNKELTKYIEEYSMSPSWRTLQLSLCGISPRSTYSNKLLIPQTRDDCNTFQQNLKPSIGNDGRHCVCVKPIALESETTTNAISPGTFKEYKDEFINNKKDKTEDKSSKDDVYELYQSDFLEGTFRITESGTYKLMSDIEFDFNAGNLNTPNSGSSWWPLADQSSEYPGSYSTRDEYFMGFFSGITIETDDVVLDLNGYELRMSRPFYYQQRFFSCISLKSVVFNLNQGPGIFGTSPQFASNVLIKNGQIGLSSHFGIHGHGNTNIRIEDVHIHSFETHGIEMSAFNNLHIDNVEIGPSSSIAYLKGEYAYARFTLQRLQRIYDNRDNEDGLYNPDVFPIQFNGRSDEEEYSSLEDVINNLQNLMDIAFKSVMKIEEYDTNDADFQEASSLFINSDGIPYGAVMYGLFLNLYFANVFAIHPSLKHSHTAQINNLNIHDLNHKMVEYLRLDKYATAPYKNPYNAAIDAKSLLGDQINAGYDDIDWSTVTYVGDALVDAHITLDLVTNDWGEKGLLLMGDTFTSWALGLESFSNDSPDDHPFIGCNGDRMTHVAKGVVGIRMDGVEDIEFSNLEISNLFEFSELGSNLCTTYWNEDFKTFQGKGHFLQNTPYLYGYTGNMAHAIFSDWSSYSFSDSTVIHDIYSSTGLVHAIGAFTANNIVFTADVTSIAIYNLGAGINLFDTNTDEFSHPYAPSVSKAFHIINDWTVNGIQFNTNIDFNGNSKDLLNIYCIFGRDGYSNDLNDDDTLIDNSNCNGELFKSLSNSKHFNLISESPTNSNNPLSSSIISSIIMISSIAILIIFIAITRLLHVNCSCCRKRNKNINENETTALTQKHASYYYGSYT